ncbi:AMP-binding protein [uncultured Desulfovibrio sp.]|uniref:AMP-binding protein n=1 Tax=uncultured Desulfovibrio sp. TaxID=167968 RepID=UPI002803E0C2|nr:AMP-binding protein [uncultured Desulfovibrio sp.]
MPRPDTLPWEKAWDGPSTVGAAWRRSLRACPDKDAVRDSHGLIYTYAEADALADRLAVHLAHNGVGRGHVVSCQLPGWAEFLPIYVACLKLGAVINPIPANMRLRELRQILGRCRSRALLVPRSYRRYAYCTMTGEVADVADLRCVLAVDKFGEGSQLPTLGDVGARKPEGTAEWGWPEDAEEPDATAAIIFTSGSEGEAKGVRLSHRNILAAERAFSRFFGLDTRDVMFMPAPVAHAIGFHHGVSLPLMLGATTVLQDHFQAGEALRLMAEHRATVTMASTPFLYDLLGELRSQGPGARPPKTLRFFICGGSAPNLGLVREARERELKVLNVYGSTESVPHMGTPPDAEDAQLECQALVPMPGVQVRVVDRHGRDVAPGEVGEEISAGAAVFQGYLDAPEATARALRDGWHHSGDLCRRLADGTYRITGRVKEIIVRGGENISSQEVEGLLLEHPNIGEAAVIGMPDARLQERVCAFVTLRDAHAPLTLADIADHFSALSVAKIKYPERLEILAAMPRTESGKIDKAVLRSAVTGGAGAADHGACREGPGRTPEASGREGL